KLALQSALSSKVNSADVIVLEDLQFEAPKTKDAVQVLDALNVDEKVLIVTADKNENLIRSANNLQTVKVITINQINVLDLVTYDKLILTKEAAEKAGEVLA